MGQLQMEPRMTVLGTYCKWVAPRADQGLAL